MIDVVPLCILNAKVVGVMRMLDGGEADDKIIAVAQDDVSINHIEKIEDFPEHLLKETLNFFEDYKKLENKEVRVEDFQSRDIALDIVKQALDDYNTKILPTLTYY